MRLNVSQRKSATFHVLPSTVAKFLADKLLLYKKNDGYGFHEQILAINGEGDKNRTVCGATNPL
jgi:hypothetical protein